MYIAIESVGACVCLLAIVALGEPVLKLILRWLIITENVG